MADEMPTFHRTPNTQTASWFLDLQEAGKLDLDPPYQRRSVWNYDYKQFFIDSIVRNYPTQAIFLDMTIDPDKPAVYKVLDGKQRLSTLIEFVQDEFPAPISLNDMRVGEAYYSDFPKVLKLRVLKYQFTVETVSDATTAELNQAFDRLNRNVSRLNSQELRHAKFGGQFITKMEKLADDDFWEEVGLITPSRRRRMLDVEYVSEFYAICLMGVQDGKDYLDLIYADFDDEIPEEKAADQLFRRIRKQLEEMNKIRQLSLTRFKNVADFYSLWAALHSAFSDNTGVLPSAAASEALVAFQEELEAQDTKRSVSYLLAARQGSNKAPNRQLRADILKKILTSQGGE